jgi:ribosome-associated translation inhibitor RaiA
VLEKKQFAMKIVIRNNAEINGKALRLVKWKMYKLKEKFRKLIYTELHINKEGDRDTNYLATIRLGVPGNDIIIKNKDQNPKHLMHKTYQDAHRQLADIHR